MGRYIIATRDLKPGELILAEAPLVIAPMAVTPPVCLVCYKPVDGRQKYVHIILLRISTVFCFNDLLFKIFSDVHYVDGQCATILVAVPYLINQNVI